LLSSHMKVSIEMESGTCGKGGLHDGGPKGISEAGRGVLV